MARSAESLSAQERLVYYRAMASEVLQMAITANDHARRVSCLENAQCWLALANELQLQKPPRRVSARPVLLAAYPEIP